ncbi:collagen alpha-1(I) chain-like isoform X3 [Manacus candei]|uniref:collagen alpha-1(I) chain-like isoform X3 n=1 Tax=Manacus candei TaxID=415023 RepID=UPI002225F47B|nr:collagen alpha-1(I) chain-like isoform X3 [Manacus candei]
MHLQLVFGAAETLPAHTLPRGLRHRGACGAPAHGVPTRGSAGGRQGTDGGHETAPRRGSQTSGTSQSRGDSRTEGHTGIAGGHRTTEDTGQPADMGQPALGMLPTPPRPGSCSGPLPGRGTPGMGRAPAAGKEPPVPLPTAPAARGGPTQCRGDPVHNPSVPGPAGRVVGRGPQSPGSRTGGHAVQPRGSPGWAAPAAPFEPAAAARPRPLPFRGGGGGEGGGSGRGAGTELKGAGQPRRDGTGRDGGPGSAHQQVSPPPAAPGPGVTSPVTRGPRCPRGSQPAHATVGRARGSCDQPSGSSLMPGKLRRSARGVPGEKQWQSLEETGSARLGQPKLSRSRTYDSPCKETGLAATGGEGPPSPALSKRDSSYRRAFGELAGRDALLGCFPCAWQREVPYHGRLYVSSRHVCFHSSLLLKDIKAVVPVASISALKKTNTALLVPNALSIRTAQGEKFLFVSLRQREATYQLLRSVCKQLQDSGQSPRDSVNNEETLEKTLTSSQSDLEQSTPEPNSLHESLGEPHTTLWAWAAALWSRMNPQLSLLNIIITIYLLLMVALLVSSGYIGLRIVELEQQLALAGAQPCPNPPQQ